MKTLLSLLFLAGLGVSLMAQTQGNPGSLWSNESRNPWRDRTASQVGDIVTILVSENSAFAFGASTNLSKNDDNVINRAMGPLLSQIFRGWSTGGTSTNSGQGSTTQTGRMATRMSAIVVETFPNGTMRIEGQRNLTVNKETQEFRITGLIRRDDVNTDNTIRSELIADATIYAYGNGPVSDRQRRGILTRLLDWLF